MQPHQNQDQPRPRPAAAAVTSAGGIGSAFLHPAPSSPQPPSPAVPSPPLINNHFTGAPSPEARGISNGNEINVDNIFASMIEDDSGAAAHHSSANSNNIFHNFATMNDRAAANSSSGPVNYDMPAAPSPATSVIPLRKYSDSTNYRSKNGMIGAADSASHYVAAPASPTAAAAGAAALGNHFISRSGSGGLSKSVGRASFMRQGTRTLSASEDDPSTNIRHAGYLLKRSNLPYVTSSMDAVSRIAPLPNLSQVEDDIENGVFNLPFGAMDESDEMAGGDDPDTGQGALGVGNNGLSQDVVTLPLTKNDAFQPIIEPASTAMTSVVSEDTKDESTAATASLSEEPCFCSPIIQCFSKLFHKQQPRCALVTNKENGIKQTNNSKQMHNSPSHKKALTSPKPTRRSQPLPITPTQVSPAVNNYIMPLKPPAWSEPVPISPGGGRTASDSRNPTLQRGSASGSGGQVSRSFSNGNIRVLSAATSVTNIKGAMAVTATQLPQKEYPPPPPDYIDPKDGHIWRAKYCILEEGLLYFYRTAEEGESDEAQEERRESRELEQQLTEEIVLGEVYANDSSPNRTLSPSAGGGGLLRQRSRMSKLGVDYQTSRKEMYDLSKSPMPMNRSGFDFTKSPFHRSGSRVLTGVFPGMDGGVGGNGSLRHSSSTSTFQQEADILWEKRVALDCVGAVRSSQQEHGSHAFELLAYGASDDSRGDDQSDVSTRASGSSAGVDPKEEIIDRLILRACDSDDMNTWLFQFHRSLMSFMKQIVDSVGSGTADRADLLGVIRPDSPFNHRRLPTPIHHGASGAGTLVSPFVATKSSFASSPTATTMTGGVGSGNLVVSLSHGHGRNALYRRQLRDNNNGDSGSIASAAISPLPTPSGTPVGGSSPVEYPTTDGLQSLKKKKSPPSDFIIQSDSMKSKNKVDLPSLTNLRGEGKEKETAPAALAAAAPASKKYVPPHMRAGGPKKYVPPHMRRKLEAASGGKVTGTADTAITPEKLVHLNDSPRKQNDKPSSNVARDSSQAIDDTLSDSALSGSTSSLLSRQLTEESVGDVLMTSTYVRLGGCADPTVVVGSILDHHYIDRKASVVGNVRLEAYGGQGGGSFASFYDSGGIRGSGSEQGSMLPVADADNAGGSTNSDPRRRQLVLKWEVGASSECGVRNSNEDSYVAINNLDAMIRSQGLVSFSQQDLGTTSQQGLYAIFDGHVGNQAARFSAEKFHEILIEEQSSLASRDSASLSSIEERANFILRRAFDRLDRDFCNLCTKDGRNWDSGSTALVAHIVDDVVSLANLGDCRGVVCRTISGSHTMESDGGWEVLDPPPTHKDDPVWDRANGGAAHDATGVKLLWKEVTEAHSPLVDEELARIEKANGWIIKETEIPIGQLHRMDIFDEDVVEIVKRCFADRMKQHRSDPVRQIQIARTCGDLAVSRAIGDRDFKAAYNTPSSAAGGEMTETFVNETKGEHAKSWEGPIVFLYPEGHSRQFCGDIVSNVPDIQTYRVGQEGVVDEFLLMACDGLWDVMDGDDAVRIAKNLLFDKKMSAKKGAARLAELAQHLGSSDNITVILIRFYWEEKKEECT